MHSHAQGFSGVTLKVCNARNFGIFILWQMLIKEGQCPIRSHYIAIGFGRYFVDFGNGLCERSYKISIKLLQLPGLLETLSHLVWLRFHPFFGGLYLCLDYLLGTAALAVTKQAPGSSRQAPIEISAQQFQRRHVILSCKAFTAHRMVLILSLELGCLKFLLS